MSLLCFISAVALCLSSIAQTGAGCVPFLDRTVFSDGEKLTFGVSYKWGAVNTEVASAEIEVQKQIYNGEPVWYSDVKARTAPFFDVFFKIREHFMGWFSLGSLRPQKCIRDTHEGEYAAYNLFYYDWADRVIHATVKNTSEGDKELDIPLKDCVCDIPSLVYFLRQMDMARMPAGVPYDLHFAIDDTIFHINITLDGTEDVMVKGFGSVRCKRLLCSVVSGAVFAGDQDVKIWVSDDENQVPVSFWAPLRVGAMRGSLKKIEKR